MYNPFKPHLVKINNEVYAIRKYSLFGCCYYYSDKLEPWNSRGHMGIITKYCYFQSYEKAQEICYLLNPKIKVL